MRRGRYSGKYSKRGKAASLVIAAVLVVAAAVGGTLAFLAQTTDDIENEFKVAQVPNEIVENFDGSKKTDVKVKNISGQGEPAYVRAVVTVNWVNDAGDVFAYETPVEGTDYTITWTMSGWQKGSDGYYYYSTPVADGAETGVLFTDCDYVANAPEGYTLLVEIAAQSIQADGVDGDGQRPVILAWGTAAGGSVTAVDESTKALTVA